MTHSSPKIYSIILYNKLSGLENDNVDFAVKLSDGRTFSFTAYTPANLLRLMESNYKEKLEWVERGAVIVRRIDEECLQSAVNACIELGIERFGVEQIGEDQ